MESSLRKLLGGILMGITADVLSVSYYGWNGKRDSDSFDVARSLTSTLHALKNTGVQIDFIAQLNDSGVTFDEIADFLDKVDRSIPLDLLDKFK